MSSSSPPPGIPRNAPRPSEVKIVRRQTPISRRTTVTLSPESLEIVERFKSASGRSTSAAIDQIIQRSEPRPSRLQNVNGFLVLSPPSDNPKDTRLVTLEDIKRAEEEMDRESVERILYRDRETSARKRTTGARR